MKRSLLFGMDLKSVIALQILSRGGIAARGLSSAGRFATVRMEHVWVNAYVNLTPSRGNRNATPPNTSTPMTA
ncbi:MAG: hypothetical protein RLZ81_3412 [Pseudomonadota bacterium]